MAEETKITKEDLENATLLKLGDHTCGDYDLLRRVITSRPRIADANDEDIFIKICVIDTTNSTHLSTTKNDMSVKELAGIIRSVPFIDTRIAEGDPAVVEEIVTATKKYGYNLFSFATKFCAYHNRFVYGRDDYSIYDSKVKKYLPRYCTDGTTESKLETLRNSMKYREFNERVWKVLETHGLDGVKDARMKLDRFLWTMTEPEEKTKDEEV